MADRTGIEWTDATWNPIRGCTRVSEGCRNCYAETVAARFNGPGQPYEGLATRTASGPRWTGVVRLVPGHLEDPIRWQKPRRIFVNSMSDLFHPELSDEDIRRVFEVMLEAKRHTFQVLTKRPERMRSLLRYAPFWGGLSADETQHIWLGTSVENQPTADQRIPELLATPASVRFVSYEPALGPVDFTKINLRPLSDGREAWIDAVAGASFVCDSHAEADVECNRLDWIICGGESGPNARPMHPDWARSARDQCQAAGIPFFFKQWGQWLPLAAAEADNFPGVPMTDDHRFVRVGKKTAGNLLDGQVWQQFPTL